MASLTLQLVLMFLIPLVIVGIAAKANFGPWAVFLAVVAAACLFLGLQSR